ncbi:MAG: EFR1 family ferrodoxin [Treponema sp.]|nr:EFR1 family ferrodoxin [Treponema sp.]
MLYFSGTGNSKYIAELFCRAMNAECFSIEEKIDFSRLIAQHDEIGFCYPVYGSRVPGIMREFAQKHMEFLKNKKVIIFCTQMFFSGDGARAFTDMFARNFFQVIYAEHFLMPNNVNNLFILPLDNKRKINRYIAKAEKKMQLVCGNIKNGIIKRRGFNIFSRILGLPQGLLMPVFEKKALDSVRVNEKCTQCGLCVSVCPVSNFEKADGKIITGKKCTICYRCINKCPQKAIEVFIKAKVKNQYKGL